MPFRLKSHKIAPPGSFRYPGFDPTPLIDHLAQSVADYRKANGHARATYAEALEDVDQSNCDRLGNHTRFCYQTERAYAEIAKTVRSGCGSCGVAV